MARPTPRGSETGPAEDDPLVELARIVSGRSAPQEPRRTAAAEEADSVTSEADIARDLEAELLSDLQATFAAAGAEDIDDTNDQPPFHAPEEYEPESFGPEGVGPEGEPDPFPFEHEAPPAALDPSAGSFDDSLGEDYGMTPEDFGEPEAPAPARQPDAPPREFPAMALRGNRGGPAFDPNALAAPQVPRARSHGAGEAAAPRPSPVPPPQPPAAEPEHEFESSDASFAASPEAMTPEMMAYQYDPGLAQPEPDLGESAYLDGPGAIETPAPEARSNEPQRPPVAPVQRSRSRDPRLERDPYGKARARRSNGRAYAILGVFVVAAIGVAAVLVLGGGEATNDEPPLITADAGPIRVMPEADAGAGDAAGAAVFDRVDPDGAAAPEENLLDGAEPVADLSVAPEENDGITQMLAQNGEGGPAVTEPRMVRTVTVLPDGRIVDSEAAPADGEVPADDLAAEDAAVDDAEAPDLVANDGAAGAAGAPEAADPVEEAVPANDNGAPEVADPVEEPQLVANAGANIPSVGDPIAPGFYVQVSAQGSEAAAQDQLADLRSRAPSLLGDRSAVIQRAELPQGTYFRLQFGPLGEAEANQLRQSLAAVGIDSFVTTNGRPD